MGRQVCRWYAKEMSICSELIRGPRRSHVRLIGFEEPPPPNGGNDFVVNVSGATFLRKAWGQRE